MDYAALPPEVNSGRMYAGAGAGPMLAAAATWEALAAEVNSIAASYGSVVSSVSAEWLGPGATAMASAAAPFFAWMQASAGQAEQVATQAKLAATAYEAAFAMTVPPPVIAANRAQLASLVATNILGQNTSAIAATEAHYAEMWAQDASAMYAYAADSAAASVMAPFTPPQPTTSPAALTNQAAAVSRANGASAASETQTALSQLTAAVPSALQGLATPTTAAPTAAAPLAAAPAAVAPAATSPVVDPALALALTGLGVDLIGTFIVDSLGTFVIDTVGLSEIGEGEQGLGEAEISLEDAEAYMELGANLAQNPPATGLHPPLSAGMGEAGSVSGLSVPPTWTAAAPALRSTVEVLPGTSAGAAPQAVTGATGDTYSDLALGAMAGRALGASRAGRGERPDEATRDHPDSAQRSGLARGTGIAAEIRELAQLRDEGILTDKEFTARKQRLLDT